MRGSGRECVLPKSADVLAAGLRSSGGGGIGYVLDACMPCEVPPPEKKLLWPEYPCPCPCPCVGSGAEWECAYGEWDAGGMSRSYAACVSSRRYGNAADTDAGEVVGARARSSPGNVPVRGRLLEGPAPYDDAWAREPEPWGGWVRSEETGSVGDTDGVWPDRCGR
ncbi:hypothetical protein FA95DRAFT_1560559 [Auriscalpium vulgare]|uniref:Uncharacterized protein n=1 Tax=Auriscalpium vulgare TaxID=40419 RepID=A0ACB8RRB1_9AGAM|nr:hypothetical protein FA95DRAFT_1560559 [Auriscalpium vulgare]